MIQSPPKLRIPASSTTVSVRIIDTTSRLSGIRIEGFMSPAIKGHSHMNNIPAFSFLVEHPSSRKLLFDLGVRKDPENFSPRIRKRIEEWDVTVNQDVREQLEANGVEPKSIEAIIWSHWHWDHLGDPSTFPPSTALIVGPGFKDAFLPGFPASPESPVLESDYEGRELREINFKQTVSSGEPVRTGKIGRFESFDYFGDRSFYLLDIPGHAIGHMCALARVTPNTFIFMAGDSCHHGGEFRPSQYRPIPSSISPNPLHLHSSTPCPGSLFEPLYRDGNGEKPFYSIADLKDVKGAAHDVEEAERTVEKVIEADALDEVLVVMAHDETLLGVVDLFPDYANRFKEKGWTEKGRWLFLKDFAEAVKQ